MTNESLAKGLLFSLILGFVAMVFDSGDTTELADGLYTLSGLGDYVFGIWLSLRILGRD